MKSRIVILIVILSAAFLPWRDTLADTQYWDTSTNAGYQHGDGVWSTNEADVNSVLWNAVGGSNSLSVWTNGNDAYFGATGGTSLITIDSTVTAGVVAVTGSVYSLVITNGGQLSTTNIVTLGRGSSFNRALITGNGSMMTCGITNPLIDATNYLIIGSGAAVDNVLCVDDGAVLNTMGGRIGVSSTSSRNMLILTNGAKFYSYSKSGLATNHVFVGQAGPSNQLMVVGTAAKNTVMDLMGGDLYMGGSGSSISNQMVIDGGGDENGAIVTNVAVMKIGGQNSDFNYLLVTNKGRLYTTSAFQVGGLNAGAHDNTVIIAQGGKVKSLGTSASGVSLTQNNNSHRNKLFVRDPGSEYDNGGKTFYIGGGGAAGNPGASFNSLLQIENEAVVTNVGDLNMGSSTYEHSVAGNQVIVTNKGKLYSAGTVYISSGGPYNGNTARCNTALVTGASSVWNMGGGSLYLSYGSPSPSNMFIVDNGGLVTNVGSIKIPGRAGIAANSGNTLIVTNGGSIYASANSTIGWEAGVSGNNAVITGPNSLWHLGGKNLTIGNTNSGNFLTIDQGGTLDSVGTLTVYTNNYANLNGGTLGVSNMNVGNGLVFNVGDGTQIATLKALGGALTFTNGLLINSNAFLIGRGTINGGDAGVVITNTATFSPGIIACGTMTISGSNLTWYDSGIYDCEITNFGSSAGVGWDFVNINASLNLVPIFNNSVIKLDTRGQPAAGFQPNVNYLLPIMTLKNAGDFVASSITLDTNSFLNAMDGVWSVTNIGTNVYVNYQANSPSNVVAEWDGSSNGNWSVGMNWKDRMAPTPNSESTKAVFGAAGNTYYSATNDLGTFWLNNLMLTNMGTSVPLITGSALEFREAGASIEEAGSGSVTISNAVSLTTNLILGGSGTGTVTVAGNITGAGTLTKQSASTFALRGSNSFAGLVTVDGVGGTLRLENIHALGTNSVVVNSGILSVTNSSFIFGSNAAYRTALITGNNSLWTNASLTIGSNSLVTIQSGARLAMSGTLAVQGAGALIITNGASAFSRNAVTIGSSASNNILMVSGNGSLLTCGPINQAVISNTLYIGTGATTNNMVYVGDGATLNILGAVLGNSAASAGNSLILTNGVILRAYSPVSDTNVVSIGNLGSSNMVVVTGGGAGGNTLWDNGGGVVYLGQTANAAGNSLVIDGQGTDGGAVVTNVMGLMIWGDRSPVGQSVLLTNKAQLFIRGWSNGRGIQVGGGTAASASRSNTLTICQGSLLQYTAAAGAARFQVGVGITSSYNVVTIRDPGTLVNLGNNKIAIGFHDNAGTVNNTGNVMRIENEAVVTNASVEVGSGNSATCASYANLLVIATGGKFYQSAVSSIGGTGPSSFNTGMVVGATSLWDANGFNLSLSDAANASNNVLWIDAGVVTNVNSLAVGDSAAVAGTHNDSVVVTNGGRLHTLANSTIGTRTGLTNDSVLVTGAGSLWGLNGANLTIGMATSYTNFLAVEQDGTLDNIGTLTVQTNNTLYLRGGTLGAGSINWYAGGLFTVGDGTQAAMLRILGGTASFTNSVLIQSNATLMGRGAVSGGTSGAVVLTNGATLMPGLAGAGALNVGSNLTWYGGSTYRCAITDMNLGAGLGWSVVTVATQLNLVSGGNNFTIKMDSLGAPVANFDPNANYRIKVMSFGAQTGYDPAQFTIDTNSFLSGSATAWTLTNVLNDLYLVYKGGPLPDGATLTWQVPNTGIWSEGTNWVGGAPPAAGGDPSHVVSFGDNGTPYTSTNDLDGGFQMNQWQFTSASAVTNIIKGNGMLVLTNNGLVMPRLDYLDGANGAFIVSNAVTLAADTTMGGDAFGGTVLLRGAVTNLGTLTKNGSWTLALATNNNFPGPVVVDSPGGMLRADSINALNGSGSVTVTNGVLFVNWPAGSHYFANAQNNRRGWVVGSGAIWSNVCTVENNQSGFSLGSSNVQIVIDGGKMYWSVRFHAFNSGSSYGTVVVTNGGQLNLVTLTYGAYVGNAATNCTMTITGPNSILNEGGGSGGLMVGEGGSSGNVLRIDNGAVVTNVTAITVAGVNGNHGNSLIVTNGGKLYNSGFTVAKSGSANNRFVVTGSNSFWQQLVAANQFFIGTASGTNNVFLLDNGAVATNIRFSAFANSGTNSMIIANGGKLYLTTGYADAGTLSVGPLANSNVTLVTGAGSVWNGMGMVLAIASGNTCSWNRLTIENGGLVTNFVTVTVASGVGSASNTLEVNGGTLSATTLAFGNTLVNDFTITSNGQVGLNTIVLSNANHRFNFNGGTLTIKNALVSNGLEQVVGDGAQPATLNIQTGGTNIFINGLIITNNATLSGVGLIRATTTVYGTVSPGTLQTAGALTNAGGLTLTTGSILLMGLSANTTPGVGWDYVAVSNGTLSLGGTLKPVLPGSFAPSSANSFVIMTNLTGTRSGFFNNAAATGARVFVFSNDLNRVVGTIRVTFGGASVVLDDYKAGAPNRGAVLMVF